VKERERERERERYRQIACMSMKDARGCTHVFCWVVAHLIMDNYQTSNTIHQRVGQLKT